MKKKNLIAVAVAMAAMVNLISCGENEEAREVTRPVKVLKVSNVYDFQSLDFPAVTQERQESQLSFRVPGTLIRLDVDEGQKVNRGDLLAQIDSRDFRVDLLAKEARYKQTNATKERFEILYEKNAVSKNELDIKVADFLAAKSRYDDANNALSDTKLFAPFSGFVDKKPVENYEEVKAGQTIVTMVDISVIEIKFFIPENIAVQFRNFSSAKVNFEIYPDKIFDASLKEIGKKAESEGFPVTLYLDHENIPTGKYIFGPGLSCRVNLILSDASENEKSDAVYVPIHAVFEGGDDQNPSVWIVDENSMTVSKKTVYIGQLLMHDYVEIVSGINSGETVVVAGVNQLSEGQKIKFVQDRL